MAIDYSKIIGGALGAVGGATGAGIEQQANKEKLRELAKGNAELQKLLESQGESGRSDIANAYEAILKGYDPQEYLQQLRSADMSKYDITAPTGFEFDYQQATEANLNPMLDEILKRQTQGIESSAANRGSLFSGATAKKIARGTADLTAQEYGRAQNLAMQQGQNKYQQFMDSFRNALQASEFNRQGANMNLQNLGQAFGVQQGAFQNQRNELQNLNQAQNQGQMQLASEKYQIGAEQAGQPSFFGSILSGGLSGAGKALGGL